MLWRPEDWVPKACVLLVTLGNHRLLITDLGEHCTSVFALPRYVLALPKASLGSQGAGRQTCIFFSFQDS